jgi:citrate synthase
MSDFKPGLEGVVAFETEIAEPDRDGGALRYRGVDIEELVGAYRFEQVWGLLVDESFEPGLPAREPYEGGGLTGNTPADLQSVTAPLGGSGTAEADRHLRRRGARGSPPRSRRSSSRSRPVGAARRRRRPTASTRGDRAGETTAERFLLEWRGEADPKHVQAIDTYWICTCEHGLNASTFVARITPRPARTARSALVRRWGAVGPAARRRACAGAVPNARRGPPSPAIPRPTSRG